jgi:hypothetical protein
VSSDGEASPADGEASAGAPDDAVTALPYPAGALDWAKDYRHAAALAWRRRAAFSDVERFCFFIGYPRSGHSLVGSLLNAHPEVLIAHELDAMGYFEHRFRRTQVYGLLLERDEVFAGLGRRWTGYDYVVPGQFQGRWTRLRVIGDKRGRGSTFRLGRKPALLARVRRTVGVPIRAIHITRNPYDNIATMARYAAAEHRGVAVKDVPVAARFVKGSIDRYTELCGWMAAARARFGPGELYETAYERFVERPAEVLGELCRFVEVEPEPSYIEASAGIVWPEVRRKRDTVGWTDEDRRRVEELIATYPLLQGYAWDS